MTPSEDRRFYRAGAVVGLGSLLLGMLGGALDLALGWLYLGLVLMTVAMIVYVHRERRGEEDERRELARANGKPYPPPRRRRRSGR